MAASRDVVVIMNPLGLAEVTRSLGGPVVRDLLIRGERVKAESIRLAPKKTGNLAAHIVKRFVYLDGVPCVLVGPVGVPYAIWVHEGSKPHVIRARNKPLLVFMGSEGHLVSKEFVNHPGNKPNRFLVRALRVAG